MEKQKEKIGDRKGRFLAEFLPTIIGRHVHLPRGYGHAEFVVHGGHEELRKGRKRIQTMIDLSGDQPILCNHGGNAVVAVVIERLGGFDGSATLPSLQEIVNEFRMEAGVVMTLTSGEWAGRKKRIYLDQVDPVNLLSACVDHGDHWKIDYSQATDEEVYCWLRADIACRAILAKKEGRPVIFEGQEYVDLQKWEDDVSSSGQLIAIDCDDETGFRVKTVGPEPTKH